MKTAGIYLTPSFFELGCYGAICSILCDAGIVHTVFFIKVFLASRKTTVVKFTTWMIGLLKQLLIQNQRRISHNQWYPYLSYKIKK